MKLNKLLFFVPIILLVISCSGGSSGGGSETSIVTLSSITVTPVNPSIALGATEQFIAMGTYSDHTSQVITTSVAWKSDTATVATIDSTGLATAVSAGSVTITASSGSISGSTTLKVVTITSIAVTPVTPSIALGATEQFIATGILSDNTTQVLTALANWSSSDTTIATISNTSGSNGLVTSFAAGTTTITATWNGFSDSTVLTVLTVTPMDNVLAVTVNGSLCSSNSYPNKPCVSVTVCSPGTSTCQTIDDILLDTGSYGLRIFKSLLTGISLTQVISGSGSLTECVQYADGSADWGPVQTADVVLGNEPAVRVPIQIIDSTFSGYNSCSLNGQYTLDTSPSEAGFNGILGVGLFAEDCGSGCTSCLLYTSPSPRD